ncbi:MAG TPA: tetratricopeptide repeat protein, partial [Kofleriaceae bacterium]|nr:tetratricopeptide repeat protein [Kofleriaceae bacterium]
RQRLTGLTTPASARRDATLSGELLRTSRLLESSRYAEAALALSELERRSADAAEVRWLRAELLFHQGDYAGAAAKLTGLPDAALGGSVGATRRLATSANELTKDFLETRSAGGHFLIRHAPGADEAIAELAGEVLDAAWRAIGDDLGLRPGDPIRVELLGSPSDLARLSPLTEAEIETTGTIALSKYNKLMVVSPRATVLGYPWMDTLAHEYTHLLVSRLSGDSVPVWLQEGLARFQQTRWRAPPELMLSASERLLLTNALKRRRLIGLEEMHPSMAKLPSQEAAALAYAQVYTLISFIHDKVGYQGLRDILAAQATGRSARRAVADAFGVPWSELDKRWQRQLRSLDLSTPRLVKARQIRFGKGGKNSDNIGLEQVAARSRKHARLGGMLRSRNLVAAAVVEYEKALALSPQDPYVTGKLARTLVELGRHERAIELATPLAHLDETDPVPAVTLGIANAARKQWSAAAAAFEQALRTSPFDPTTRCGLAEVYRELADPRLEREKRACARLRASP